MALFALLVALIGLGFGFAEALHRIPSVAGSSHTDVRVIVPLCLFGLVLFGFMLLVLHFEVGWRWGQAILAAAIAGGAQVLLPIPLGACRSSLTADEASVGSTASGSNGRFLVFLSCEMLAFCIHAYEIVRPEAG